MTKAGILIVEDETIIAMEIEASLRSLGYTVTSVVNTGDKAIAKAEEDKPDLILMDIRIQGDKDGIETAEIIRKRFGIPVVFSTGYLDQERIERAKITMPFGYVLKPIQERDLKVTLEMALYVAKVDKERRKTENERKESEKKYRSLFNSINDGFCIHELICDQSGTAVDYKIIDVNPRYEEILRIQKEDVIDKMGSTIYDAEIPPYLDIYAEVTETGEPCRFETFYPPMEKYFLISVFSYEKGKFVTVFQDISSRKKSEEALKKSEEWFSTTLRSIGDAVITTDTNGMVTLLNPVAESLTGWRQEEARGKPLKEIFNIINEKTREPVENPVEKVLKTGNIVGLANHTILVAKDGKEISLDDSGSPIRNQKGEIIGVVLVFRDITDQYEKDRQLKERVKELNCLYKIAEIVEKPGRVLKDILQETAEVIPQSWRYPEICEASITLHGKTFQTTNFTLTKWCLNSDLIVDGFVSGEVTVCYREEKPFRDEGRFQKEERRLLNAVAERLGRIIERKQLENNLHSIEWMLSGQKDQKKSYFPEYGNLTELNNNGLILSSLGKDRLIQISSEYLDLLETSSAIYEKNGDYALGLFSSGWCQLMDAASRKLCRTDNNKEALNSGKWLCHESCWDASMRAIESGRPVDVECAGGIRLYAISIRADDEIIGAINFGYGNPPNDDSELQKLSDLYQIPIEVLQKTREEYQARPQYIIDYAKKRIQISAKLIENFVERKQAEEDLKESDARFRLAQEMSTDGFTILHPVRNEKDEIVDFTWKYENSSIARINGTDPQKVIGKQLLHTFPDHRDTPVFKAYLNVAKTGKSRVLEEISVGDILSKPMWLRLNIVSMGTDIAVFAQDITDRKKAEEKIQSSLREKEILLKEIHHRVKNNMNVVLGLLNLHKKSTQNEEVKKALQESRGRVYAMSAVHETLHNSENLAEIDLIGYLNKLSISLIQTYSVNPGKVQLIVDGDDVKVNIDKATPLGLIVNELISNALKYAFPDERKGKIEVIARKQYDQLGLTISDNGIGMPEGFDWKNSNSLGLKLVHRLVEDQLDGSIDMENKNGTQLAIRFNLESNCKV